MSEYPIVTISIINYNEKKFIFKAIDSIINQGYPNLDIIITDNNSTDGTREEIEKRIPEWEKIREDIRKKNLLQQTESQIRYIKNTENIGFGRPHNNAIRLAKGEFVLLSNADIIAQLDYVEKIIQPFSDSKVGAVQGKLLRYDFDKNQLCKDINNPELNIIDTTGLMMFKNRRIVCIGQGQADEGQFEEEKEVFGADGAMPIYRKSALEDVKLPIIRNNEKQSSCHSLEEGNPGLSSKNKSQKCSSSKQGISSDESLRATSYKLHDYEYFDENFFMYKEDVDLAWRLRLAGWKTIYCPKAIIYHGRGSGDSMAKNYIDIIKERRKISNRAKFFSFKHQRLMQIKDDFPSLLFTKHFSRFIVKEVGAWIYMAVFERFTFGILRDLYKDIPLFIKKRKLVMAKKKVSAKEMERWFV